MGTWWGRGGHVPTQGKHPLAAREADVGSGQVENPRRGHPAGPRVNWEWSGDRRSVPAPPASQSAAPSVPTLPCSTLIPGCGSSSMGTRCRPRGSPAACTSPGRGLPTWACRFLGPRTGPDRVSLGHHWSRGG